MGILFPVENENSIITSYFGNRTAPTENATTYHRGIDISIPSGTKVYSAISGTVQEVGKNSYSGNYISISDNNGLTTIYKHLSSALVRVGESIQAGEQIALSGNTGVSTGAHLHFETILNGNAVDPLTLINDNAQNEDASSTISTIKNAVSNAAANIDISGIIESFKKNYILIIAAMVALSIILPNNRKA